MSGVLADFMEELQHPMVAVGLLAQCIFFSRFLVQWIVSEKKGKSTVPIAFWYLSLVGGLLLLTYAIWRRELVFTLGQSVGTFVYIRNLMLISKAKREKSKGQPAE